MSAFVHLLIFALLAAGLVDWLSRNIEAPPAGIGDMEVRFVAAGMGAEGLESPSSAGAPESPSTAPEPVEPATSEAETPPPTPVAPRVPRPLNFDQLEIPALPQERVSFEAGEVDPTDAPPLPQIQSKGLGGLGPPTDTRTSGSGRLGALGAPRGGQPHARGDYDVDPVPVFRPDSPPYPKEARERMVSGEVILEVLVKLDGSTEVVGVIKSLPHCVDAAIENARKWRWKPAMKDGRPVEAYGIITVSFDLFSAGRGN